MKIVPGARLGAFEILGLLGLGGMGEVYRAHDTRLGRDVALKRLPERFAQDADRVERLIREARLLASLNHPNIASIYGVEDSQGMPVLVLELVEGPTLADHLASAPIALDDVLSIALQIAEALEAAHARGVIHRDLKPANIKVTSDGTVKLLDFGLAKALADDSPGSDASDSPTMTYAATRVGAVVGTAPYMSPEQAKGRVADRRADVWAFGCVLFELLTGRRAFAGETTSEVLAKVLERDPDWSALPVTTPPGLARLVRRCLQKDPRQRLHDIADARLEIEEVQAASRPAHISARPSPDPSGRSARRWTAEPAGAPSSDNSIVVLPFGNLSPSPDDEYFSDGLTDELIVDLSKIRALRVICRTSAMRLKGTEKDPRTLGRELDVRYVLAGSVRKAGSSLRITAELIEAPTNTTVWADKYSGTLADVFDVQERVSREIVRALDLTLSPREAQQLTQRPIADLTAYDCYLRARQEVFRFSSDALDRATRLLNQGLAIVGENPLLRAYLGYADVLRFRVGVSSDEDLLARAEAQARKILAGASDSAIAWTLLGMVAFERGQLQEAVRHLQRTLALEPSNADALMWLGGCYVHAGRTEAAALVTAQVIKVDPLFGSGWALAALVHWFDGRFAEAIPGMTRAIELEPDNQQLRWSWGYTLALNGRLDEAAEQAERLRRTDPDFVYTRLLVSLTDALRGRHAEALDQLAALERIRLDAHVSLHAAESHAVAGGEARAIALLQHAVEHGFHPYAFIATHDPFFESVRRDVRFQQIVAEAKTRYERFQV